MLFAAGQSVLNAVHYPEVARWRAFDPEHRQRDGHGRHQSPLFVVRVLPSGQGHKIESPRLDVVMVIFDPRHSDFGLLGADYFLAPQPRSVELLNSKAPEHVAERDGRALLCLKS